MSNQRLCKLRTRGSHTHLCGIHLLYDLSSKYMQNWLSRTKSLWLSSKTNHDNYTPITQTYRHTNAHIVSQRSKGITWYTANMWQERLVVCQGYHSVMLHLFFFFFFFFIFLSMSMSYVSLSLVPPDLPF